MTRRLAEEHDMRRLEQMEMQQRFDNNEKAGKTDITELFNKLKREQVLYHCENYAQMFVINGMKLCLTKDINQCIVTILGNQRK